MKPGRRASIHTKNKRSAESLEIEASLVKQVKIAPKPSQEEIESTFPEEVSIFVGPSKVHLKFPKRKLCSKIPFFNSYFNPIPIKGTSPSEAPTFAEFPDQEPKSFDILREWLYTGNLPTLKTIQSGPDHFWLWNPLYMFCLAYKLQLAGLCDLVMDAWISHDLGENGFPAVEYIAEILDRVPIGSAPWIYATKSVQYMLGVFRHREDLERWSTSDLYGLIAGNREFGLEVLQLMREQEVGMTAQDPRRLPACEYHVHGKDMRCPSVKFRHCDGFR